MSETPEAPETPETPESPEAPETPESPELKAPQMIRRSEWFIVRLGLLLVFCLAASCGRNQPDAADAGSQKQRIISLAPSLTETLFALGLGDCIVADTIYCETPEEAKALPKVGAWNDVNIEQVLSFQPTCVCLPATHPCRAKFEQMNIPLCAVDGRSLDNIIDGIELLGERFDRKERAHELATDMRGRLHALKKAYEGRRRLKVMVVVGRARGAGRKPAVRRAAAPPPKKRR